MKKQRVYQDYDEDDNDYPLGAGQIDFEDFDYDMNSPKKQKTSQEQQQKSQHQSLKKSDQTKPSTDKQNKGNKGKQPSEFNSNTSSIDVQIKPNQLVSVESFNPKTNEEKKKVSKHNSNALNSKESSNHNSYNNFNSKNAFTKQTINNQKKQFEVQMVEQSYNDEEGDDAEESNQMTGTFKATPDTKNTDNHRARRESKENKQLSKHKKMILEDSDNENKSSDNQDYIKSRSKNKKLTPNNQTLQKPNQPPSSRRKIQDTTNQSSDDDEDKQIKPFNSKNTTSNNNNKTANNPKKKQSDNSIISGRSKNNNNNTNSNKPNRDDFRRKSSGPHQFKKDENDNQSSNEKSKKQQPQSKTAKINNNNKPVPPQKKRYGANNKNDSEDDSDHKIQDNDLDQDQDDVGMKNNTNSSSSDEEKGNKSRNKQQNKKNNLKLQGNKSTKADSHQKSSPYLKKNQIDFYSQDKLQSTNKHNAKNKLQQDESKNESDDDHGNLRSSSSVEIQDIDGFSSNPISQTTYSKKPAAKGFAKQKAIDTSQNDQDEQDQDEEQILDTNPENMLLEHKKKNRMSLKTENFFNFEYDQNEEEDPQPDYRFYLEEQGVAWAELNSLNEYFKNKKMKKVKKRRHVMKYLRARNLFFTSKWFMFFHLLQNVLFWMVVIVFPVISVIGCDGGHKWMSHVAMAFYLGLFLIFDVVFAFQYISSKSDKYDLKGYSKNKTNRNGKCCHMIGVWFYCIFEMLMTQVGLFDIYCDMAFATLVAKAGINDLSIVAFFSIALIAIPKLYALILQLLILFCQVREEDKKRKYAQRILLINEYRMQAANIDYIEYEKSKTDLWYGLYKLAFEDIPQFVIKVIFLTQHDCGRKYTNGIVYCGLLMALFNTYFGLLYRFGRYCYSRKRLKSYEKKVEVKITNLDLSEYGFRHLRDNVHDNRKVQSVILSGQNYEYMILDEKNIKKYEKFMTCFPKPERVEFFEINKVKFKSVRQEKSLFKAIDTAFKNLRYLTIQECGLCPNFILQFKIFIDGNDSLARLSLIMNKMPEDECYELLENCLEHPNLEIIQLAERNWKQPKFKGEQDNDEKKQPMIEKPSAVSVCRGIQFRLQQNEALKLLEIRYINLSRQIIQAIFKGLQKNKKLQRLVLTNDALKNATIADYKLLGETLRVNASLQCLDLQDNSELNENMDFHTEIIDGIVNSSSQTLKRICITTESFEVKANYLEMLDQRSDMVVFVGDKVLEDVDIQE